MVVNAFVQLRSKIFCNKKHFPYCNLCEFDLTLDALAFLYRLYIDPMIETLHTLGCVSVNVR